VTLTFDENTLDEAPPSMVEDGFIPQYPGATPEAPFGYFKNGNVRKRPPRGSSSTAAPVGGSNEKLARQAVEMLSGYNTIIGMFAMLLGLPRTSAAIAEAEEGFREIAVPALTSDPKLCRRIIGAPTSAGMAGLAMAYAMLMAAVGTVAVPEFKAKRAEAQAVKDAEEG
jgi:hypothetical protein